MQSAIDAFRASMRRVRDLHGLHATISGMVTSAIDLSDILRAEVVLAVSAFDYFVHEFARLGMLESHSGARKKSSAFERFNIPLSQVSDLCNKGTSNGTLDQIIREQNGFRSFQQPDQVAEAIRLVSDVKLWDAVGAQIGQKPEDVKRNLKLVVERRNKIAHEADLDPSYPNQRWPIDRALVEQAFLTLESTAEAIHTVAV